MIQEATQTDYQQLSRIWESAVSSTHDFLEKEDYEYYKSQLTLYFKYVKLYTFKEEEGGEIKGFLGVAADKIEMLFVHNDFRRQGIGKTLINFAIDELKLSKVDVNEQNIQALNFYKLIGFKQIGYSEIDQEGKPYPIVYMSL
ncbi:GNAT family N-acetyltransferase [Dysgonomonas sp. 520]|uniref:GNAT family N-acetyltransferase n=1 Tax=Dysgonomonas sp. 520 TaxID=2302931 RepID=UPI0013D40DE7|nr:GNAT family N-acetyltransferase [Dysgonomonas sp. 520]NDW08835.1 GNAT family N-acetyltransferase [Dysgonomonas sp. 520]